MFEAFCQYINTSTAVLDRQSFICCVSIDQIQNRKRNKCTQRSDTLGSLARCPFHFLALGSYFGSSAACDADMISGSKQRNTVSAWPCFQTSRASFSVPFLVCSLHRNRKKRWPRFVALGEGRRGLRATHSHAEHKRIKTVLITSHL